MHVVVVGCGRVGSQLASKLEVIGHTVSVIDMNHQAFRRLPRAFAGQRVVGSGFDHDHLLEAGIEDAGALAAVTSGDNTNVLAARIARESFDIERVVARIYDPRRAAIYQRFGIATVATVAWATEQVLARLFPSEQTPNWVDSSTKIGLVTRAISKAWTGRKLIDLQSPGHFWLCGITRLGNGMILTDKLIGQEGDQLHFMTALTDVDELDAVMEKGPS